MPQSLDNVFGELNSLIFSPLQEAKCGYAIILMALYWCTECIPLAVTALLPVILFPMMGILESTEVLSRFCLIYLFIYN